MNKEQRILCSNLYSSNNLIHINHKYISYVKSSHGGKILVNKKIIILIIILVSFLTISVVSAADNTTRDILSVDDTTDVNNLQNNFESDNDWGNDKVMDNHDVLRSQESQENISLDNNNNVLSLTSPSSSDYKVSISSQTIDYDKAGTIRITITPCTKSGYYKYDFELIILDSNNIRKLDKIYSSTSYSTSESYAVSAGKFNTGTYTMQILNRGDRRVMSSATLTIKSSSNPSNPSTGSTYPSYTSYNVILSDTTINYGSSGSIYMQLSPASGYTYTYYYTLKIYDSSNNVKASKVYSGTSYSSSQLYHMNANQLSAGTYTVKIINYADSKVMDTATLTVKSSTNPSNPSTGSTYPSSSAYSVSVSSSSMTYGSSGSISMSISPASSSTYKYYYTLKVYDSNNNLMISRVYSGTSAAYSKTYSVGSNELSAGTYTVKIINYADSKVMSTATLTVKSKSSSTTYPSSSDYSVKVSDTTINYGSSGSITMDISSSATSTYKFYYYLKVYDSNNKEKISQLYYGTKSTSSKIYSISSSSLSSGTYTIKIINYQDSKVMKTAKLTVKSSSSYYPSASDYSVEVSDTTVMYGSSGSIVMSITPASENTYKYYYYLKVYDFNDNEKISELYYGSSSVSSKTYSISSNKLGIGTYTIKIINYYDSKVMDTAKLIVKKTSLETQDIVGTCDKIIEYKVRASENDRYKSGLKVTFICNGNEYDATTDNDGYATLKIHLKAGSYDITTKFGSISRKNTISVDKVYVADKYDDIYVKSLYGYYNGKNRIQYGWKGNFEGFFKIYKGNSLLYQTKLNTNGYVDDYFKYDVHDKTYDGSAIKNIGDYNCVITDNDGNQMASAKIKIVKSPTHIKCPSVKVKIGSKKTIAIYIYDKSNARKNVDGAVEVKINGKTYKVKVVDGLAKIKSVKLPSKIKTYTCSVKFLENKNFKASSAKFKVSVRKLSSEVDIFCGSPKTGAKTTIKAHVYIIDLSGKYAKAKSGIVKFTFNGKTYKAKVKNGLAKITVTSPSKAKTYSCKAIYLGSKSVKGSSNIFHMIVKPNYNSVTLTLHVNSNWYSQARLKTGDVLLGTASSYFRQHGKGVSIGTMIDAGQEGQHSTRLIKAKVWFENDYTGNVITRTHSSANNGYNIKKFNWIDGYTPYKAQVWYKHR